MQRHVWRGRRLHSPSISRRYVTREQGSKFISLSSSLIQQRRLFSVVHGGDTHNTRSMSAEEVPSHILNDNTESLSVFSTVVNDASLVDGASGSALSLVQSVQALIEQVHLSTGLPWWATLAATGFTLRISVLPFYIYQIKAAQRYVR